MSENDIIDNDTVDIVNTVDIIDTINIKNDILESSIAVNILTEEDSMSEEDKSLLDNIILAYYKNNNINENNRYSISKIATDINKNNPNYKKVHIIKRLKNLKKYRKKLNELKNMPLIKQRTEEWFNLRKNRLTASDLYDAINKSNECLAKKKAGVIIDNTNFNIIPPLKWGTMFEPMAIRCYSHIKNNIEINEFGLIPDKNLEHFGASPDGINELGIMIEIKCPYTRQIKTNFIPPKYYMQIQGQLAVCGLEECEYIECDFKNLKTEEDYLKELNEDLIKEHGIIAEFKIKNSDEFSYLYSEAYLKPSQCINNIKEQLTKKINSDNSVIFNKLTYWKLEKINIQRVYFNEKEWNEIKPKINSFWEKVESLKGQPIEYKKNKTGKLAFIPDDD
jgi:putative phage-type endonuclease